MKEGQPAILEGCEELLPRDLFQLLVALGLILLLAVELLDFADELFPLAFDQVPVIVGELAPLRAGLAAELFLVAFDAIPVHEWLALCWRMVFG